MKIKNGQIFTERQVQLLHPHTSFTPNTYAELGYEEYIPPLPALETLVPQVISRLQGEAILLLDGNLSDVEVFIATSDELTRLVWKRASEFQRNSPMLNQLATALGWTQEYLDSVFVRGATFTV